MPDCSVAYIFTPVEFGGAERVNLSFLRHVDRRKFEILPILLVRPWEQDNHVVRELEKDYRLCTVPVARRPRSQGRDPFRVLRCYRRIYGLLRSTSFDLVHTHGYFADIVGLPAARLLGIPHISTCHGFIDNDAKVKGYNALDRFVLRFSDRVIAVSDRIRSELAGAGIPAGRIVMIQNAVRDAGPAERAGSDRREKRSLLGVKEPEFLAGYAGRLSEEKGLRYLLPAYGRVRRSGIPVRMVLIGHGPQRPELERLAVSEGLNGILSFAGFVTDVERWLPALDAFVLPSLTEGTPMAMLEAMAAGLPVVASAVGGIPDVIDHDRTGLLVPPADPAAIEQALVRLQADPALCSRLGNAARQTVLSRYGIDDWTRKVEAEYLLLANRTVRQGVRAGTGG